LDDIVGKCEEKIKLDAKFRLLLQNNGPVTSSWKFTVTILNLLYNLRREVEEAERNQSEEERSIEVLSLQTQLDVQKIVELLVGFGLLPYLLPGIGVPEKIRKKNYLASELFLGDDKRLPHLIQFHRLAQVLEVLLEVSTHPSLNSLIVPKHAADILACLLQICKSPIAKPPPPAIDIAPPKPGALTEMEYEYVMGIRDRMEFAMKIFIDSLQKSLFINSLFLIGATEKPKWVRTVCNEILYDVLLSPNGLILISSTLLTESSTENLWKVARVISNLMRGALILSSRGNNTQVHVQRMTAICSQCVRMIVCPYSQSQNTSVSWSHEQKEAESVCTSSASSTFSNKSNFRSSSMENNEEFSLSTVTATTKNTNNNATSNLGKDTKKECSDPPYNLSNEVSRVGIFCSVVLMDIDCNIVRQLIWNCLFDPVLQLNSLGSVQVNEIPLRKKTPARDDGNEEESDSVNGNHTQQHDTSSTSLDIEKVITACDIAEGLLSLLIPTGVSLPLLSFQPVWSLLFQVFVACTNYLERKVQEYSLAQLAQKLRNKLENIFISLFEVVSSGLGDSLDLAAYAERDDGKAKKTPSNFSNNINPTSKNQVTPSQIMTNLSESKSNSSRLDSVCKFCIHLLLNESESGNVQVHKFQLQADSSYSREASNVKIVLIAGSTLNSSSPRERECITDENESRFRFSTCELLEEQCSILCTHIFKHERLVKITSQLFRQLLAYENARNETKKEEIGNSSRMKKVSSSHPLSTLEIKDPHASKERTAEKEIRPTGDHKITGDQKRVVQSQSQVLTQLELEGNQILPDEKTQRVDYYAKFVTLKLLSDLGEDETVVEECVKKEDYKEALKLVEVIMKKLTSELECSLNSGEDYEFIQSISFALGILGIVVETAGTMEPDGQPTSTSSLSATKGLSKGPKVKRSHYTSPCDSDDEYDEASNEDEKGTSAIQDSTEFWKELKIFIPHLRILEKSGHPGLVSAGIPVMAQNILRSIETQGLCGSSKEPLTRKSEYERALEDAGNPMPPIKGHGLLQLRRLIEKGDVETLRNERNLVQIFEKELINEDSYVYLMAIQGLAAVGLKFHKLVIPILVQEYDFINPESDSNGCRRGKMYRSMTVDERIECRMKIGEVLVKIIQKLGEIAPAYRVPLTNLYFRVLRDDDPLIRTSALSNLAELCHLLKFSLGSVLTEVSPR